MSLHGTFPSNLWRRDFGAVAARPRRLARIALGLYLNGPGVRERLHDRDFLGALWRLTLPVLNPAAVRELLGGVEEDDRMHLPSHPDSLGYQTLLGVFRRLRPSRLRPVWERLAAADGMAPLSPTVTLLGTSLALDADTLVLLDFLDQMEWSEDLRILLRECGQARPRANLPRLAAALGLAEAATRALLRRQAPARTLELVVLADNPSDLEDFACPSALLRELLNEAPPDEEALLGLLIEPAPAGAWRLEAFPHLAQPARHLRETLAQAAAQGAAGVNALLYGAPGTGKTELARALAGASGLRAYQVRSADEDLAGLSREGRLSAYLVAQRLLARRRDALLIFDEVEDVFDTGHSLFALLGGGSVTGRQKGWMNRILEENPVPAIWITNGLSAMDPAFLRRFLVPVACGTPPRSVRRQMAEWHLGDQGLAPELLDELAADEALAPAQWGAARRLLDLRPDAAPEETVRHGLAALRTLLHGSPAPRRRTPVTAFDVAFLNLAGDLSPSALVRALDRHGRGSLCFYGLPGTGKTAFAEILAEALDRELIARPASALLSPYVGETEQNLARLFRDCDPERSILLLDEVDSFLHDRRQTQRTWERTQVNELLQQMERFPGIFIAATNLMAGLDGAALRRFDFKLHFRPLTRAQRLALFAREALGDAEAPMAPDLARALETLTGLTPGDFATVRRQQLLLDEPLTPTQFLRRLALECQFKQEEARVA